MNNNFDGFTLDHPHNTNQVNYFLAIKEILNILLSNKKECNLIKGCKIEEVQKPNGYKTSHECKNSPWNKVNDEKLCFFAILWKLWKLSGKQYRV